MTGRELVRRLREGSDCRLLLYFVAVQAAANMAGPFFTPFMLRELDFSYSSYVAMISTSLIMKALLMPAIGNLAMRWGAYRVLWIGGITIVPLPALWLASQSFGYLLCVQALAGATWAMYELGMFLLFFDAIPARERTSLLTTYNLAHASATIGGSLLGGALLAAFGATRSAYLAVFALSGVARLATLLLLWRVPRIEVKRTPLATRSISVRPSAGTVNQPVLATLSDAGEKPDELPPSRRQAA